MTNPDTTTLLTEVRALLHSARAAAARQVNTLLVLTNFQIGRSIVEHEQGGDERAEYGAAVIEELSRQLTSEFGRGFSAENLRLMRLFYLTYQQRFEISQTPSRILTGVVGATPESAISAQNQASGMQPNRPFMLSWSHYVFLMAIKDEAARSFYEIESTRGHWSLKELRRQFDSALFERLALSRDKDGVRALAETGQIVTRPEEALKDPYVLEFLGLDESASYSESDLESRIVDKLENFLRELGTGFLFEGRQRRFSFDDQHFYVDLVFYHRLLRCFVLIDLKIGQLTHQDLGQMQMYVNYYDRFVKLPDESPTIGILLCRKKNDAVVEITLPQGANIHAREYTLALPSAEELRRKLLEWTEDEP
jgi:predicted nuclease of restriction endonuclease-like (RecB) superfamily